MQVVPRLPPVRGFTPLSRIFPMSKQQMPGLSVFNTQQQKELFRSLNPGRCGAIRSSNASVFFRSPDVAIPFRSRTVVSLVGAGLVYPEPRRALPGVNPGTMQIAEQPGVPSRVVVFGNIWKKARLKRARQAPQWCPPPCEPPPPCDPPPPELCGAGALWLGAEFERAGGEEDRDAG